jgi:hypothetical protein
MADKYDYQPRVDTFVINQHLATSKQVADHTLGYQKKTSVIHLQNTVSRLASNITNSKYSYKSANVP